MNDARQRALSHQLQNAHRILVVSHIRPDGDAVGSLIGLGLSLQASGRAVEMVLSDGLPANFRFLEGAGQVRRKAEGAFDLTIVVDCSDLKRTGEALNGVTIPDWNIDHHVTNLNFARINLVDSSAVATAEILASLLPALGLPITQPVAAALLVGLVTDTLGFQTSNLTPKALRVAASLMEYGVNLPELYRQALVVRSFEATRYWASGLNRLEREDGLVWTTLTQADRVAVGYPGRDDADLINILSSIEDMDIAVIFVEQPNGRVKVSWRARPGYDVSQIALGFGGGGHPAASGADIPGGLDQVRPQVLQATLALLAAGEKK